MYNALKDLDKSLNILERDFPLGEMLYKSKNDMINDQFLPTYSWIFYQYVSSNMLKGEIYYKLRNFTRGLDCYCSGLRLFKKGSHSVSAPKKASRKTYNRLTENMDIAKAMFKKGKLFLERGDFIDAIKWYLLALEDNSRLEGNPKMGIIHKHIEKIVDAIDYNTPQKLDQWLRCKKSGIIYTNQGGSVW